MVYILKIYLQPYIEKENPKITFLSFLDVDAEEALTCLYKNRCIVINEFNNYDVTA